jgi:glycosyltransferase involved in cell wall biosynthesis
VPAARRAARVVMFSRWARAQAARALGIDRGRIAVVTQGAGPFDAPPPPAEVRATLGRLGLQPGYVLAGGAGDRRKNTPFLLEVMHRLAARGGVVPELVLTGAPYGHVHAPEPPAAGPPAVRRLGFVTDRELSALYAGAGVFCFPSLAEGFGRPPLEALACGAPVVAADYGSASEVLGGAATILPLHAERWADAVTAALQSGQGRSRRITVGRAHAAAFQWGQAADQILAVCRAALPAPSLVARQAHAAGRPAGG